MYFPETSWNDMDYFTRVNHVLSSGDILFSERQKKAYNVISEMEEIANKGNSRLHSTLHNKI